MIHSKICIVTLLLCQMLFADNLYRVAVVGQMPSIELVLKDVGIETESISYAELASKTAFAEAGYDCIYFTGSGSFPQACSESFNSFLRSGGDVIFCGSLAFDESAFETVLPVFSDDDIYRLEDVVKVRTFEEQNILKSSIKMQMSLSGVSAVGFEYAGQSRYQPLLEALDKYGRRKGFVAGVLVHYDGPFKGGNWIISGVKEKAFYQTDCFKKTLIEAMNKLKDGSVADSFDQIDKQGRLKVFEDKTKELSRLELSSDGKHLVYPDGRKFYMIGTNYIGSFDRKCSQARENFDVNYWERDFKKAAEAGINCMRVWIEGAENHKERISSIIAIAKKYGIYLLLQPTAHPMQTDKELSQLFGTLAEMAANEPIVIGFDLMNEPYITTVGSVEIDGKKSPIIRHRPYKRYLNDGLFDKNWVDSMAVSRNGWPEIGKWMNRDDARELYAAHKIAEKYIAKYTPASDYSSLYGLKGKLPIEDDHKSFVRSVEMAFAKWIDFQKDVIKQADSDLLVTVGYNTSLEALSCNEKLDFASHHLYQKPLSYDDVLKGLNAFDRLRDIYPDKPVTLGEFGFSTGLMLLDGSYLDADTSAMAELAVFLYGFAGDYGGAMSWMVSQWPVAMMDYNAWWIVKEKQKYEAGFGLYSYDGSINGSPRPIAYGLKMFSKFANRHESGWGDFKLLKSSTPIGAGYIYTAPDALFVGARDYADENISFNSEKTANVMLIWNEMTVEIVSTCDLTLSINQDWLGIDKKFIKEGSVLSQVSSLNRKLSLGLLAGEVVVINHEIKN